MWRYETSDEIAVHSTDVLEPGRLICPWFSLLYMVAGRHLGQAAKTSFGRWMIIMFGALVSATDIAMSLPDFTWDSPVGHLVTSFQLLCLLLFLALVWKFLSTS